MTEPEVDIRPVPPEYEAWCHEECGKPVTSIEVRHYRDEEAVNGFIVSTPRMHVVPHPCRHDRGPVSVRKLVMGH